MRQRLLSLLLVFAASDVAFTADRVAANYNTVTAPPPVLAGQSAFSVYQNNIGVVALGDIGSRTKPIQSANIPIAPGVAFLFFNLNGQKLVESATEAAAAKPEIAASIAIAAITRNVIANGSTDLDLEIADSVLGLAGRRMSPEQALQVIAVATERLSGEPLALAVESLRLAFLDNFEGNVRGQMAQTLDALLVSEGLAAIFQGFEYQAAPVESGDQGVDDVGTQPNPFNGGAGGGGSDLPNPPPPVSQAQPWMHGILV